MSTYTEVQHPRVAAGSSDGGKFATKPRTEAEVALAEPADETDYAAMAREAIERVNARNASHVGDPMETAEIQLRAIAAIVKDVHPWATAIVMECSDQEGCDQDMHVVAVLDENGEAVDDADLEVRDGTWEEDVWQMGFSLWDWTGQETPGVSDRTRGGRMNIDLATATAPAAPQPDGPEQAASRGADVLAKYRALHDKDVDDEIAVRDLLTDLHHWARANGVDLDERFAAAGQYADEEEDEPQA